MPGEFFPPMKKGREVGQAVFPCLRRPKFNLYQASLSRTHAG